MNTQDATLQIRFQFNALDYENLKEKQSDILCNIIEKSRLGKDMKFDGFYTLSPAITENGRIKNFYYTLEKLGPSFVRRTSFAIGFDISESERNTTEFDKLFIFQHAVGRELYYDYCLVNTKTSACISHFYKDHTETDLLNDINKCFNRLMNSAFMFRFLHLSNIYNKHITDFDNGIITLGL